MSTAPNLKDVYSELISAEERVSVKKSWGKEAKPKIKRWKQI